jgi:hypothetical protein
MAKTTRQTAIFGVEDWKRLYQTFREADFQSYDFETLRKSFIDYLRNYYPETFNDFVESSEYIAMLDVIAFMGQSLAFRNDLNARENFLDTAERRDSVVRLANLVSYTPKRNSPGSGFLKVNSINTTENITDFNGIQLANLTINWNDPSNTDWFEQFTLILNSALVSSQKYGRPANTQTILGIATDEYTINMPTGFLPVVPYSKVVDGTNMAFEAVSATSLGETYVYEPAPRPDGAMNVLYRNDQKGFGSQDTGFFFLFKQGVLQDQNFNIAENVPNRTVNINIEGVNQNDHWLYQIDSNNAIKTQWEFVENIFAGAVEQTAPDQRQLYSITSRSNDQITLTFGDGVFSEIPVGQFRTYVRASNGLEYIINEEEMQSVVISLQYVSRIGRTETIKFTCGITTPITNSENRETINEIKQRAPARFYTQNRMVNGEDYNNFPFTTFNSIIKSKAIARSSIGSSRYIDLGDVTSKYSSTNIFASDGMLYRENNLPSFNFEWITRNDINDVITGSVEPLTAARGMLQFYYANFARPNLTSLNAGWQQSTTLTNQTSGYFYQGTNASPLPIGEYANNNAQYIERNSLVKFVPTTGFYFDENNRLIAGTPTAASDKMEIWATVLSVELDGTAQGVGNLPNGNGPVVLNNFVPTGALASLVIPRFINDLPTTLESSMITQIELYRDFGIGYNNLTNTWYIITSTNLSASNTFSLTNAQDATGMNLDASWLVKFTTDGSTYTVTSRSLDYKFASVTQTRFTFDGDGKVYDSKTGSVISDFNRVLKTNSKPDTNTSFPGDITMDIIGQTVESDGYKNDYEVTVSFTDSDADGVADNPDFFDEIVAPSVNASQKLVFFQLTMDFDNLERYLPCVAGTINTTYATLAAIELVKNEFADGQLFYATSEYKFYKLSITTANGISTRTIVEQVGYLAKTGRGSLAFQYRHNSPLTNVIDPGITNIIDVYLVTQGYYTSYQNYITDTTGTVKAPQQPTIDDLTVAYSTLDNYKMVSDNMILNSVTFKPLFGAKSSANLRARIKVVKALNTNASNSEIKTSVVREINNFFTIDKWDFGDTFYFSELSAYLHRQLGTIISSVVLVPLDTTKSFGDLYEVRSQPNEIFVSSAVVSDIEVIGALTQTNINSASSVTGLYNN